MNRLDHEVFCSECRIAFGLLSESPLRTVCLECWEKLGQPALTCDRCYRGIPPGERFHLGYVRWCGDCAKKMGRSDERRYQCSTVAWRCARASDHEPQTDSLLSTTHPDCGRQIVDGYCEECQSEVRT